MQTAQCSGSNVPYPNNNVQIKMMMTDKTRIEK